MRKRFVCMIMACLMALSLVPDAARAVDTVCFTAVNETMLDLNDATMPCWSDGVLYAPSAAVDGTDLDIKYSYSRDKQKVVLYKQRNVLIFDLNDGTVTDNNGRVYSHTVMFRSGTVFLPVSVLCKCFDLSYSYKKVDHGYLLRLKDGAAVLSDTAFIDAAAMKMEALYDRYERAHAPEPKPDPAPATDPTPATPVQPPSPPAPTPPPEPVPQRTACLAVVVSDAEASRQLLATAENLGADTMMFLFTEKSAGTCGDLLRQLAAGAQSVALRVDASEGPEAALAAISRSNSALWKAANRKTRLVVLDGASEETLERARESGFCPLGFTADFSGEALGTAARLSAQILAAADANQGSCTVLLGRDDMVGGVLYTLLYRLRQGNCRLERLTEFNA